MEIITALVIVLGLVFWPIGLFLGGGSAAFLSIISPKLAPLPLLVFLFLFLRHRNLVNLFLVFISLTLVVFFWQPFYRESIFPLDNNAQQIMIMNRSAYTSPLLGRLFHNKATLVWYKFRFNLFALTDPNNYFFGFHPREIVRENLNLPKFPFTGIVFFFFGLYYYLQLKQKGPFFWLPVLLIFSLSLTSFDRTDFVLFPILSGIYVFGVLQMRKKLPNLFFLFSISFFIFTLPDLLRLVVNFYHP